MPAMNLDDIKGNVTKKETNGDETERFVLIWWAMARSFIGG